MINKEIDGLAGMAFIEIQIEPVVMMHVQTRTKTHRSGFSDGCVNSLDKLLVCIRE